MSAFLMTAGGKSPGASRRSRYCWCEPSTGSAPPASRAATACHHASGPADTPARRTRYKQWNYKKVAKIPLY